MCGEIGGSAEEDAAEYIGEHVSKPVLGYIAGFTAPRARRWATPARSSRLDGNRRGEGRGARAAACVGGTRHR